MKFLLPLILTVASFTANAQNPVLVNTLESSNETYPQFIERAARFIDEWTAESNVELCGILTHKDGTYRVILSTNYSQLSCKMSFFTTGDNFTGDTIHSHPKVDNWGRIRVTPETNAQDADFVDGKRYVKISNQSFSLMDYNLGSGFLVVEGKLYYQNGRGTQVLVTEL